MPVFPFASPLICIVKQRLPFVCPICLLYCLSFTLCISFDAHCINALILFVFSLLPLVFISYAACILFAFPCVLMCSLVFNKKEWINAFSFLMSIHSFYYVCPLFSACICFASSCVPYALPALALFLVISNPVLLRLAHRTVLNVASALSFHSLLVCLFFSMQANFLTHVLKMLHL